MNKDLYIKSLDGPIVRVISPVGKEKVWRKGILLKRTLGSLIPLSNVVLFTVCSYWIICAPSWVAGKCSLIRKRMTRMRSRGNAKQNVPVLNYLG